MASLKDLGPLTKTINVRGVDYELQAVTAQDILDLFSDYPNLEKMMAQKVKDFNAATLIKTAPDAIGMIIATSIGKKGDAEEAAIANKLGFGDQVKFMASILEISFPDGVGPFVDELKLLTRMIRPNGKVSDTASPAQFSAQLVMVGRSRTPGEHRRVN